MNKNAKLLPQLNQLFLQRQSYTSHKKRIIQIKTKKPRPKLRQQIQMLSRSPSRQTQIKQSFLTSNKKSYKIQMKNVPAVIQQNYHSLGNSFHWMSPYDKKKHIQEIKQNTRLKSRLKSSKSQLQKDKLQKQYQKFAKIKQRLMKYKINPESHKAVLKCQTSLNNLSSKSRITLRSQKGNNKQSFYNKKKSSSIFNSQQRKQSNFSAFVKRTQQLKLLDQDKKSLPLNKQKPQINYTRMLKNLQDYEKRYDKRIKTEFSKPKLQKLKINKNLNTPTLNFSYSNLTQIDI